jgi:hypothetical protein
VQCVAPPANLVSWYQGEDNAVDRVGGNNGTLKRASLTLTAKSGAPLISINGRRRARQSGEPENH